MTIGEKIKMLRAERGMTQTELAGGQITRNMLSLIESGSAQPSLSTVMYVAERLKVAPGYLLADEEGDLIYRKNINMPRIRAAYSRGEFEICRELCLDVLGDSQDDETYLILAECSLGVAKEAFFGGHLRLACREFDIACEYAGKTIYNTQRIFSEAAVFGSYMRRISPSLYLESDTDGIMVGMAVSDGFCRYALAIDALDAGQPRIPEEYAASGDFLCNHIRAKLYMQSGDFAAAHDCLKNLLNSDDNAIGAVMYDAFRELEQCCRENGDFKGAYEYSNAKVLMLERLLSDEI
ncbi:MAG: helix-turn-helix transcriptional regulator [Clostridia bacterium]|nr:helix-turn-helix transcriptional regulator [Clostridia bacterium]